MNLVMRIADASIQTFFKWVPRPAVTSQEWQSCQLISHRGCHDNGVTIHENTIDAFDVALQAGIWGIEFDIQWTRDGIPVVIHDPNTARLPGEVSVEVGQVDLKELQSFCPVVPTLENVVNRYAGKMHMMIELKNETFATNMIQCLPAILSKLQPAIDFHFLSLEPEILRHLVDYPIESKILVAITNTNEMYEEFQKGGFGGFAGHILLLNTKIRRQLAARGLPWGTGFVDSPNSLAREIRSGTRWMFSDCADKLADSVQKNF